VRWLPRAQFELLVERARTNPRVLDPYPFEPLATLRDPKAHAQFVETMRARAAAIEA
jgi:hypothetical protein